MKLSIVTVNRNNAAGLRATLESTFRAQPDFDDWEQIVVDGASTDGSFAEIAPFRDDPHLGWCVSEPDSGIYNAMNKGAAHACGDYLLFLNSGDTLLPDVLAKVFAKPWNADIAYGDLLVVKDDSTITWIYPPPEEIVPAYFLFGSLPHPASFISNRLFQKLGGYDETYRIVSDAKFFLDSVHSGIKLAKFDYPLSRFCYGGISSSDETESDHRRERTRMLESAFGRTTSRFADRTTEARPWIREATARTAQRDPSFAEALLRATDLCAALWRGRLGRTLLSFFARYIERREKRIIKASLRS